jgi:hypothetical protein
VDCEELNAGAQRVLALFAIRGDVVLGLHGDGTMSLFDGV